MFNPFKKKPAAATHGRLDALREEGEALLVQDTREARQAAYARFIEALELIPEPHDDAPRAARLYCGLGDVYFQSGNFDTARNAYTDAVRCRDALGDARVHLRLGKVQFELGELDRAADELCRAYLASAHESQGMDIFAHEDDKYFAFLQTRMSPPKEGW